MCFTSKQQPLGMNNEANMKIPKAAFPKTATSAWLQNQVNPQRQRFDNTQV